MSFYQSDLTIFTHMIMLLKTLCRQDTREAKLRIADVMTTLGEIGLESGM